MNWIFWIIFILVMIVIGLVGYYYLPDISLYEIIVSSL